MSEQALSQMYERLQDLWDRADSVDDVFEDVSGYMHGLWGAQQRINELEDGLRHIRDYHYSVEMCREIASATLDGRDDYQEPPNDVRETLAKIDASRT